ncbi:MAG: MBL fold metallo-hydrolase [Actinomyces sp.]|uniref:MBL fold metallo-hydrolase n=1 Tax=Actinomyces sp. TaxID=29317 RepID=UPI0026DC1FA3|nr:MBL fold metallo-hydrolase [Actinomyces sp.]MDO4243382.1 MBL fold metallo-hydrolase [Actinomyces sp.]
MKLTIIGCTGSMSGPRSSASSYLLQARGPGPQGERIFSVLLDLGPGSMGRLLRHVDPAAIDAVAISHCHADHMVDLVGMHVYRRWHPGGALGPVLTLGPSELLDRLRGVDGTGPQEDYSTEFAFVTAVPGQGVRVGPMMITPFAALHPVESYGYRIEGPSEHGPGTVAMAFTGDTDLCGGIEALSDGVDLLLAEAAFLEGRDTFRGMHLTGRRAGELAAGTSGAGGRRPARRLVLTHIQPWTDPADTLREAAAVYSGPLHAATSDATWEI